MYLKCQDLKKSKKSKKVTWANEILFGSPLLEVNEFEIDGKNHLTHYAHTPNNPRTAEEKARKKAERKARAEEKARKLAEQLKAEARPQGKPPPIPPREGKPPLLPPQKPPPLPPRKDQDGKVFQSTIAQLLHPSKNLDGSKIDES